MSKSDFTTTLLVEQSPEKVFSAIKNVSAWWSGLFGEEFKGKFERTGDEFTFRAGEGMHYSKQKLVELIPDKKIVWLVTESDLTFIADTKEWTGTKLCFEISEQDDKTLIRFTHIGLTPEIECFNNCSNAWNKYVNERLLPLINSLKE